MGADRHLVEGLSFEHGSQRIDGAVPRLDRVDCVPMRRETGPTSIGRHGDECGHPIPTPIAHAGLADTRAR